MSETAIAPAESTATAAGNKARKNSFKEEFSSTIAEIKKYSEIDLPEIKKQIEELKSESETSKTNIDTAAKEIEDFREKLLVKNGNDKSIRDSIINSQGLIIEWQDEIHDYGKRLLGFALDERHPITKEDALRLPKTAYIEEDGEYFKVFSPGIKQTLELEIAILRITLNRLIKDAGDQITNQRNTYNTVESQIIKLLPGATSAGLASGYESAKETHQSEQNVWRWVFVGAIVAMIATAFGLHHYEFYTFKVQTFSEIVFQALKLLTFEIPSIWLALLANKRIHQQSRLYEEYMHKWAVASTFEGLRREAEKLADDENKPLYPKLLESLIKTYGENPSETLDKKVSPDHPFTILLSLLGLRVYQKDHPQKTGSE